MNDHRHGTAKVALPGCTPLESLILRQLVAWYTEFSDSASTGASYNPPPTTKRVTEYLRVSHRDALAIMNRLEMRGLLRKERRLYLQKRGLSLVPPMLRVHPALWWLDDEGQRHGPFPTLLSLVVDPEERGVTLHRIYLTPEGSKAPVSARWPAFGEQP